MFPSRLIRTNLENVSLPERLIAIAGANAGPMGLPIRSGVRCTGVDFCSAKGLVRSWFRTGAAAVPEELMCILRQAFGTGLWFSEAVPECIVQSDKFRDEQRNCDLYGFGLHKLLV